MLSEQHLARLAGEAKDRVLTLGELVALGEELKLPLSQIVVGEAMIREGKSFDGIIDECFAAFEHNLKALEQGLESGNSFVLGTVATDLARQERGVLIDDVLIDRALVYTLAAEVGNHEVGLRPCAGTGDSCPYTGLLKALMENGVAPERVRLTSALILKVGSIFRAGKVTTGCNMEGYGAGAAATAAALTDLRGGTAAQVAKAMIMAISPTIGVPCTPRVVTRGLCATHIGGAILIGNLASNLILKSTLPVDIDIDVMIAMAARIHREAAPAITTVNVKYLKPYFKKREQVEALLAPELASRDAAAGDRVLAEAREELRGMMATCRPLTQTFGEVVVGGSSIAVGSPTNMARIAHALKRGKISKIEIDLTKDLYSRRAINVPAILMGAVFCSHTSDGAMYAKVMDMPEVRAIDISLKELDVPEVQRIRITAEERSVWLDSRNRGGARVAIVNAEPSREAAIEAAHTLGIQVVD
ncbi:MAG: serine dehydratase [Betaproteobacteria bacterium]|nr:serine dehydratase [Betaproteobacteria bacterium]